DDDVLLGMADDAPRPVFGERRGGYGAVHGVGDQWNRHVGRNPHLWLLSRSGGAGVGALPLPADRRAGRREDRLPDRFPASGGGPAVAPGRRERRRRPGGSTTRGQALERELPG